jgi:hypothetical protein
MRIFKRRPGNNKNHGTEVLEASITTGTINPKSCRIFRQSLYPTMAQYATYTKYYAPEEAQFLMTLLQQHDIPYALEHEVNQLDKVYIGETVEAMFVLKVPNNRFNDVHALLAEQAKADMARPDFEHHL